MIDKQPEALRLADELAMATVFAGGNGVIRLEMGSNMADQAAAELRRLHEVNAELVEALSVVIRGVPDTWEGVQKAKVVIDKSKEKNNG